MCDAWDQFLICLHLFGRRYDFLCYQTHSCKTNILRVRAHMFCIRPLNQNLLIFKSDIRGISSNLFRVFVCHTSRAKHSGYSLILSLSKKIRITFYFVSMQHNNCIEMLSLSLSLCTMHAFEPCCRTISLFAALDPI